MTEAAEGDGRWAALVPELLVADLGRSQEFYCGLCGFALRFARPEDGFAYLDLGGAQIMLEELAEEVWITAPLERPFGRGINLQIEVEDIAPLAARLVALGGTDAQGTTLSEESALAQVNGAMAAAQRDRQAAKDAARRAA